MSAPAYPYVTFLNVLHKPLEVIDAKALADSCTHKWYNQSLCEVNGSVVRLGVFEGEYHWHQHTDDDEFFFVLEGKLLIDLQQDGKDDGRTVELSPGQGFVVPKATMHRTRAQQRTVVLMVENIGIVPTGDQ
jgi:mannose-6-phosphate isomerase-like protein (cupin superfamily)